MPVRPPSPIACPGTPRPFRGGIPPQERLVAYVVDAICAGKIVGWFQGRMEFGARALGNRFSLPIRDGPICARSSISRSSFGKIPPLRPQHSREYVADFFEVNEPVPSWNVCSQFAAKSSR